MKLLRRSSRNDSVHKTSRVEYVSPVKDSSSEESEEDQHPMLGFVEGDKPYVLKLSNNSKQEQSLTEQNVRTSNRRSGSGRLSLRNNDAGDSEPGSKSSGHMGRGEQIQQRSSHRARSRSRGRIKKRDPLLEESAVDSYNNMSVEEFSRRDKQIHLASDIYQHLASDVPRSRKSKKSIAPMPTLNEATTEEDESTTAGASFRNLSEDDEPSSSFDSWDETQMSFDDQQQPPPQQQEVKAPVQPTVMQLLAMDEHGKACEQIKGLISEARSLAAEGREEDAIQTYKRALQIGRQDVHRIKAQLTKKCSLTEKFYDLWLEIGVLLAELRTSQASLHELLMDYSHATSCVQEAMSIYRRQAAFYKPRSKEKARGTLKIMQSLEAIATRIETANKHDSKRKQMHESILQYQRNAAAATNHTEKLQAHRKMEETSKSLRALETAVYGEHHPLVADSNSLLGAIALEQGNPDAAVVCMKQALLIMKKVLGMKHPRTGTKLLHLASVYASQGQDLAAIDHYNMAVAVFRSCSADKLVGSTLNDTAVIHIRRKEFDKAIQLLRDSLEAYKSDNSSWDTVQVWRNLGECYSQQREFLEGASALVNALNVQREGRTLLDNSSTEAGENLPPLHLVEDAAIADTLRRLGKAYYAARKYESALSYYKEACLIHKAEVKKVVQVSKSRSNSSLPVRQDELAQTIYCMAELYDHTGEYDQAAKLYSESLQLRLFSDAHKETRSNMVHCAMCLYGLGGIHLKGGEVSEAVNVMEQAMEFCKAHGVTEGHVIHMTIQTRLEEAERSLKEQQEKESPPPLDVATDSAVGESDDIKALELKASEAIRQGNLEEAISMYTTSMQRRKLLLQSLKEKGDKALTVKYDTACTLYTFGKALAMRGDYTSAEKAFKDSLKLLKKSGTKDSKIVLQICGELQKMVGMGA